MLLASACTASGQRARTAACLYFSSSQPPMRMLTTRRPYFHPRCTSAAAALEELLLLELAGLSSRLGRGATILLASIESSDSGRTHPPSLFLAVFAADTTSAIRIIYQRITSVQPPPSGEAIRPPSDLLF